jgi:hypothetical protein
MPYSDVARLVDRDGSLLDLVLEEYLVPDGVKTGLSVQVDVDATVGGSHSLHLACRFAEIEELKRWLQDAARGLLVEPVSLAGGALWIDCVQDADPRLVVRFQDGEAHLRPTPRQMLTCAESLEAELLAFPEG